MLTISISTMTPRLEQLLERLNVYIPTLNEAVSFLVVCQCEDTFKYDKKFNDNIQLVFEYSSGLSKSRNRGIREATTEWIWFQDDDISLNLEQVNEFVKQLSELKEDVITIRIGSLEKQNEFYKNYTNNFPRFNLWALQVSSIEIIARLDFVKRTNNCFDERFGLGTQYPCTEENLFCLSLRSKNATFKKVNKVLCFHTTLDAQRIPVQAGHFIAKGHLLRHYPLLLSLVIMFRWSYRVRDSFGCLQAMKFMFKGRFSTVFKGQSC